MKSSHKKISLHFETLFICTILLTTMFSSITVSADGDDRHDQIAKKYSFKIPHIEKVKINDEIYDKVVMPDAPGIGNPGEPNLPVYEVQLLLPPKTEVKDIDVSIQERVFLGSGYNIEPSGEPVPMSMANLANPPEKNEEIYNSADLFPDELFTKIGTYSFRGYNVLVLVLHPIQYVPKAGKLYYFPEMTVSVNTFENKQTNLLFRNIKNDEVKLLKKIDNPLNIAFYVKKIIDFLPQNDYDLLILTTDEFKNSFEPLKEAHDSEGIKTEIKTLKDISLFPDDVTPEDIRDFIKDEYLNSGIEYVLIGGDDDIIPAKNLFFGEYNNVDIYGPSDNYYACLDGTYNYDGDKKWGESTDGEKGEDVDLVAEVYIGRASVGSISEVNNFIDKTKKYMESDDLSNVTLMVGEKLSHEPVTWGGDYMDEIINESNANMYTTLGFPPNKYTIETLYDRDWFDNDWPISEFIDIINQGVHVINHIGHSSSENIMKLQKNDINLFANNEPFFAYSQGCKAGSFDRDDCIAEHFTIKTENGAFAGIWNARYGWFALGSTNGASQRFNREFWDAVFGENINEIGKANQDSKEDLLYQINYPYNRWCYYQLNLFGDPTLRFFNDDENNPPTKPSKPAGVKIGKFGEEYSLKTISTDYNGDMIYYRWDFGDGTYTNWLGPYNSSEEVNVSHSWSERGRYSVRVKSRDEHREESDWSDNLVVRMPLCNKFRLLNLIIEFLEKYFPNYKYCP